MLPPLPIVALVLALAAPATAQDSRVWNFDDNPEAPTLGFGAPDSDDVVIAFSFVVEGISLLRSVRQARPTAASMERDLIEVPDEQIAWLESRPLRAQQFLACH